MHISLVLVLFEVFHLLHDFVESILMFLAETGLLGFVLDSHCFQIFLQLLNLHLAATADLALQESPPTQDSINTVKMSIGKPCNVCSPLH